MGCGCGGKSTQWVYVDENGNRTRPFSTQAEALALKIRNGGKGEVVTV